MEVKEKKLVRFWKNKRVLITGHTGFKGGWLSLWLSYLGTNVLGYSLKPKGKKNFFNTINLSKEINSVIGNIKNYKKLSKLINEFQPDIIFHMAAQPLVIDSYINPRDTYETNVMGTKILVPPLCLGVPKAIGL